MNEINDELLLDKYNHVKSYLDYYDKYGAPLVAEFSKDLDDKVRAIQTYLNNIRQYNLEFDVASLQKICIDLSSTIYFTNDKLEQVNLLADMAKMNYKEAYSTAYLNKQGAHEAGTKYSVEQLRNHAEQEALPDNLINFIYSRAASILKGKIDAAYELLKSCSKSLSGEIQAMSTYNVGNKYGN